VTQVECMLWPWAIETIEAMRPVVERLEVKPDDLDGPVRAPSRWLPREARIVLPRPAGVTITRLLRPYRASPPRTRQAMLPWRGRRRD
jgi:hypothetical protein